MKTEGDRRKSTGMDQVLGATNHEWAAKYDALAVEFYKNLQPGMRFTGEDMRDFIEHQVKEKPHKPQSWGAKFNGFIWKWIAAGTVIPVDYRKSMRASNHSRICRVYQKVA